MELLDQSKYTARITECNVTPKRIKIMRKTSLAYEIGQRIALEKNANFQSVGGRVGGKLDDLVHGARNLYNNNDLAVAYRNIQGHRRNTANALAKAKELGITPDEWRQRMGYTASRDASNEMMRNYGINAAALGTAGLGAAGAGYLAGSPSDPTYSLGPLQYHGPGIGELFE